MAKKPTKTEPHDPEDPPLIDTDHPEDKALIRQIKRVAQCNATESAARDDSQNQREKLLELMHERGLTVYKHGRYSVSVRKLEKISVKSEEENGDPDD